MTSRMYGPAVLALALLVAALPTLVPSPATAGEISLKTENYLFAASEALADGDPALALSLLRRAKEEDPDCCIVDEYLARTYTELGQLDRATESYADFVGCMEPSDEPIREELEELLAEARRNPPDVVPDGDGGGVPLRDAGGTRTVNRGGTTANGGRPGLVVAGIGGGVAAGFGVTATVTFVQSRVWLEQGDRETYEARKPINNVSLVLASVGGGIALVGLIADMATSGRRADARATGERLPVIAPGPGELGLSASWRF